MLKRASAASYSGLDWIFISWDPCRWRCLRTPGRFRFRWRAAGTWIRGSATADLRKTR